MNNMYANRVTLSVNDKEAFFMFELVTPHFGEDHQITSEQVADSSSIIMTKEALVKVRNLIDECIKAESKKA